MITTASNEAVVVIPDADGWWSLTLDDALPMFGEGRSWEEAQDDLASGVAALWRSLDGWPDDKLSPHLLRQRDFLRRLGHVLCSSSVQREAPETPSPNYGP